MGGVCKVFVTISVNLGISYFLCVRNLGFLGLHGGRGEDFLHLIVLLRER